MSEAGRRKRPLHIQPLSESPELDKHQIFNVCLLISLAKLAHRRRLTNDNVLHLNISLQTDLDR
jgi:hypothetical protein